MIFVEKLPRFVKSSDIRSHFSAFGKIEDIQMNLRRGTFSAFVLFKSAEDAQKAVNGHNKIGLKIRFKKLKKVKANKLKKVKKVEAKDRKKVKKIVGAKNSKKEENVRAKNPMKVKNVETKKLKKVENVETKKLKKVENVETKKLKKVENVETKKLKKVENVETKKKNLNQGYSAKDDLKLKVNNLF